MSNAHSAIPLEDLLAPTASSVLKHGTVIQDDPRRSLWLFAQDAFGWQNWMEQNDMPFSGSADDLLQQAAGKLSLSEKDISDFLATNNFYDAVPACVYKGNQEEGNGNTVAWSHVFNLSPDLARQACPPDVEQTVFNHIGSYRKRVPKQVQTPVSRQSPIPTGMPKPKPSQQLDSNSNYPFSSSSAPKSESPRQVNSISKQKEQLDGKLATLGREIVDKLGDEQDGQRKFSGKVKYRISVNLSDNTMRIYAKDRGDMPILVDADGRIDHANSQVRPEDVKRFQTLVDYLHTSVEHKQAKQKAQIEP